MVKEYEAIILCKNENGKFRKQIKLGENFVNDVNNLSNELLILERNNQNLTEQIDTLNYKINSLIANKIFFNLKGIKFNNESEKISSVSADNFLRVAENLSEGIYSLLFDLQNNRQSGDPKAWKDSILFLITIFQRLKSSKFYSTLITKGQNLMLENQFSECIRLFTEKINKAIKNNNDWLYQYNPISCFFGLLMGYKIDHPDNNYLRECLIDYQEIELKIENKPKVRVNKQKLQANMLDNKPKVRVNKQKLQLHEKNTEE